MNRFMSCCAWLMTLAAAAGLFGWTDGFHRVWGGVLLAGWFVGFLLIRRRHADDTSSSDGELISSSPVRGVAFGIGYALTAVFVLAVGFFGIRQIPWAVSPFYDNDRQQVEEKVATLTAAGNHEEAARVVRERLAAPATADFEKELANRLYRALVHAGRKSGDLPASIIFYNEACGVVEKYHQHLSDDDLAATLLEQARREQATRAHLEELRGTKQWRDVAHLTRALLTLQPRHDDPAAPLAEWLVEATVECGKHADDPETKHRLFQEARELAEHHRLKPELAAILLVSAKKELEAREQWEQQVKTLTEQRHWPRLVGLLQHTIETQPRPWPGPLDRWLFRAHHQWADATSDEVAKRQHLTDSLAVATKFGLDPEPAATKLKLVEAEARWQAALAAGKMHESELMAAAAKMQSLETKYDQASKHEIALAAATSKLQAIESKLAEQARLQAERARRAALPKGCRMGIVAIRSDVQPPVLLVEVWVDDAKGASLLGLQAKDFQVTLGDQPAEVAYAAPIRPEAEELYVVLALDISGSMRGPPLTAALQGAKDFLGQVIGAKAWVEIIAFNGAVHRTCAWTQDAASAAARVDALKAEGNTALYQAMAAGLDDLRDRKGQKRLVVLSDGMDTVGGPKVADLIARCRKENVVMYTIGLKSDDLDRATLKRMADETGGLYTEAGQTDLAAQFAATSRRFGKSYYRLVVAPTAPLSKDFGPIVIRAGGENGVTATATAR